MEPFFPLSWNVFHACGFTSVQTYIDQNMSSLSGPFFVSQKLHLNIKTQKHYCNNHNRTVCVYKIEMRIIRLMRYVHDTKQKNYCLRSKEIDG